MTLLRSTKMALIALLFSGMSSSTFAMPYHVLSADADVAVSMLDSENSDSQIVSVDYCYAGSITDPTTGETVDLYVFCAGDGVEQNFDLA